MANYVLLYTGGGMAEGEEAQAAMMNAWGAWFGALGADLVDGGLPFTGQTMSIATDGTASEGTKFPVTGYSVIKAGSMAEAVEKAKGSPVLQGPNAPAIAVYETMDM